jgi:hypothetical protein
MMRFAFYPLAALSVLATPMLPGQARAEPVTVTRFIAADAALVPPHGTFAVTTPAGVDPAALEWRPWIDAITRELAARGFALAVAATPDAPPPDLVAEVRVDRQTGHVDRTRPPVSVGMAGETGSWHSGFGLGIGFSLGGSPRDLVTTHLVVTLRDRASGRPLWEARAENTENARGKRGGVDIAAPRLAQAVFTGFPGHSGETITVK